MSNGGRSEKRIRGRPHQTEMFEESGASSICIFKLDLHEMFYFELKIAAKMKRWASPSTITYFRIVVVSYLSSPP